MSNQDTETIDQDAGAIPNDLAAGKNKTAFSKLYLLFVGIIASFLIIAGVAFFLRNLERSKEDHSRSTSIFDQISNSKPHNFDVDKASVLASQAAEERDRTTDDSRTNEPEKSDTPPPLPQGAIGIGGQAPNPANTVPTLKELARARRLGGDVWADGGSSTTVRLDAPNHSGGNSGFEETDDSFKNSYAGRLRATATPSTKARMLEDLDFLLVKGTNIRCTNIRIITTDYPGQAQCVVSNDVYSSNGRILLIERGSIANGEYRSELKPGQRRIFVLWTEIITPKGALIPLMSGGADALGGSGHPAQVDTHFWERFGGAMMFSIIDDGLQIVVNETSDNSSGTNVNINSSTNTASQIAAKALEASINIAPTGIVYQGDILNINVARHVDFRGVYDAIRQ